MAKRQRGYEAHEAQDKHVPHPAPSLQRLEILKRFRKLIGAYSSIFAGQPGEMSAQVEAMQDALTDSRARSIYRKGSVYGDEDDGQNQFVNRWEDLPVTFSAIVPTAG
jgi:hypothetical protein